MGRADSPPATALLPAPLAAPPARPPTRPLHLPTQLLPAYSAPAARNDQLWLEKALERYPSATVKLDCAYGSYHVRAAGGVRGGLGAAGLLAGWPARWPDRAACWVAEGTPRGHRPRCAPDLLSCSPSPPDLTIMFALAGAVGRRQPPARLPGAAPGRPGLHLQVQPAELPL